MNDSEVDHQKLQTQLAIAYRQLPPLEEKIVQLFSVIYEPINRTSFVECLNRIGARDHNYKPFVNAKLKPYLDGLLAAGLLVQEQGQGPQCHPLLVEIATRSAVKARCFEMMVKAVQDKLPVNTRYINEGQLIREVRIGFYRHDPDFINKQIENYHKYSHSKDKISINKIFEQICNNPFDSDWFGTLPQGLYESGISSILLNAALKCSTAQEPFALLEKECSTLSGHCSDYLQLILTEQHLLRGCVQEAQQSLERISDEYRDDTAVFWGWLSFLRGENDQAIKYYTVGLKALRKAKGKQKVYFNTIGGLFFILALLKDGSPERLREAEEYASLISCQSDHWLRTIYGRLKIVLQVQQGDIPQKEFILSVQVPPKEENHSLETLFCALCLYWVDAESAKKRLPKLLEPFYQQAVTSGFHWLAMEIAELLSRLKPRSTYDIQAGILRQDSSIHTIVDLIRPQEPWEMCLKALANLRKQPQAPAKAEAEARLAWYITYYPSKCILEPREQKMNARGEWSKGRPIAIKRLSGNLGEFDYLTPQDIRVCGCIETFTSYNYGYQGKTEYTFSAQAISALIGHPLVFWEDAPTTRVEIVKGEPELLVKKGKLGRLGSFESFNQRFAIPIEKFQDKQVRSQLKKLIQPFLLRRTKNQVLQELPNRTEILLHVELSREEMAFYEALRREAISKLTESEATAGQKHLQVLAEIMKLRRACCHPSLVMADTKLSSSKLQLFGEVLGDLLENRHKALVFSQFVGHLHIIRDYLDKQGINYQYLDGSTPVTERKKRVDAFQAGSGDVFLISLKAGGTGLNLTAADYVIHMDPWWNPAVEDQASDRAHRIGQQRPVTIYRLVAKDTIEDKIVNLHHHKRDLADSLLEGADISGKISTEALLELIGGA